MILELLFVRGGYLTFDNYSFITTSDAISLIDNICSS